MPLDIINKHCVREKSIRHGHPSTLHLYWARRPLAACTAVIFGSIVDDPSSRPDLYPTKEEQLIARQKLFDLIDRLCNWDNWTNQAIIEEARSIMLESCDQKLPEFFDPFCGAGTNGLAAQRLGLVVHVSDLNPVAVLIAKAGIEIPHRFANCPPVNPTEAALQIPDFSEKSGI